MRVIVAAAVLACVFALAPRANAQSRGHGGHGGHGRTPAPEPLTIVGLGIGASAIGLAWRRRNQRP